MITDERQQSRTLPLGRIAGAIALVVFGWLAVVVALTFGSPPGKSMAIVGPPSQALAAIAKANGRILASNDYFTIAHKGRFFLPYQLYYSKDQLQRSYPQINDFFAAKRKYDPSELFTNTFYQKYAS